MSQGFQGGVCGGNWWNSSTNLFRSSPCSSAINGMGAFGGWPSHDDQLMDMKTTTRSSSDSAGSVSDGSSSIVLQDQMMGINLSSSTITDHNWNQDLIIDSGRSEETYSHLLQEATALNSSMNYGQQNGFDCTQINKQWSSNNFSQDSSITNSSSHGLISSFPLNSASFSYNLGPHSLLENQLAMNYSSATNYNQMINSNGLQFTNNTAFWNATDEDLNNVRTKSQFIQSSVNNTKPSPSSIITAKYRNEEMGEISSSVAKKDKIETPSPLPTFKVRKEKMGDKITALQQLVSPFGKTDTESVLHEATEYIKFLHDQVTVLSSPYMKNGSPPLQREIKDQEGLNIVQGLKSRGLCLVPVSSTFSVTSDQTSTDFWTPTFGGSFSYRGRTPVPPLLNCYCHETTSLKTCWKGDNAGRRFRSCDNYKEGNSCGFSVWVDPPMCEQSKLIILGLLRRLDKIEAEKAALHGKKEAMEQKEGVAKKMFRILVACLCLS